MNTELNYLNRRKVRREHRVGRPARIRHCDAEQHGFGSQTAAKAQPQAARHSAAADGVPADFGHQCGAVQPQ